MGVIRDNWRIVLLILFVVSSGILLFVPGAIPGASGEGGPTNLQYGIQLAGGSRIQAPPVGITAEGVDIAPEQEQALATNLSQRLDVQNIDVRVTSSSSTVEIFDGNVSQAELRNALEARGYEPSTVRSGVTQATRQAMVSVIRSRITQSALGSGSVSTKRTAAGQVFISISAPDRNPEQLQSLVNERGVVRILAGFRAQNGTWVTEPVLQGEDLVRIGNARLHGQAQQPGVQVTVRETVAPRFQQEMVELGFGQEGGTTCRYNQESPQNSTGHCMMTELNGEIVFSARVTDGLADLFRTGEFVEQPIYVSSTRSMEQARELEIALKSGRLDAPLNFSAARTQTLDPALAQRFRFNSLITGLIAVLAVSFVVYLRYGEPRVAIPMIFTAMSEVLILLGFVSLVQFPLNLSHIAGFIAVIGTGVDDLIIIADEILQQGEVATGRVFRNRFRKAFWVIGAAAATTILAMAPLTVLGLGDLTGFAIVTIVGVLVGVLITRPAYGDILRNLILSTQD